MTKLRGIGCVLLPVILVGCSISSRTPITREGSTPPIGVPAAVPIIDETAGQVEYMFRYYHDADLARSSFAAPMWDGGCSATMIGPRFVLTAAHCGPGEAEQNQSRKLTFVTYRSDQTGINKETYDCKRLVHGWPQHDLALLYCNPGSDGIGPGDRYGYLDLETRAPQVDDSVYSVWWNPVTADATQSLPLYSQGVVLETNAIIWRHLLELGPAGDKVGIHMSTVARPGASGSGNIDRNTHRILVGPTSLANQLEGPDRWAFSMRTYLGASVLAPGTYQGHDGESLVLQQITKGNFPVGVYNFAGYAGKLDKNGNGVFDVQEDVERQAGETQRSIYNLAFDNRRRNALWSTPAATIEYGRQLAVIKVAGEALLLQHPRLTLKPDTNYRIGVRIRTGSAASLHALSVGFEAPPPVVVAMNTAPPAGAPAPTVLGGSGTRVLLATSANADTYQTALLKTGANPKQFLTIRSSAAFTGSVAEIFLIEDGKGAAFELFDEREAWTAGSLRANFLPRGLTAAPSTRPDFALALPSIDGTAFPASTNKLLFLDNRVQRICFRARILSGAGNGRIRIAQGHAVALDKIFPLTENWTQQCYRNIRTPHPGTMLTFSSSDGLPSPYLVDEILLTTDRDAIVGPLNDPVTQ